MGVQYKKISLELLYFRKHSKC